MPDEFDPQSHLPVLQGMIEGLDSDTTRIQTIADRLVQGVGASLDEDKAALKTIKGRLNRTVSQDVKKGTGPVVSEIGRRMRTPVVSSVDADEQIVSRLGTALGAALPPAGTVPHGIGALVGAPTAPQGAPCEGAIRPRGWHQKPDWQISQADCPVGWGLVSSEISGLWCCPPGVPLPGQGGGGASGGGPSGTNGGISSPSGTVCPPCPTDGAPSDDQPAEVIRPGDCRLPRSVHPGISYVVPWLNKPDGGASYDSDCGIKAVREASAATRSAADLAAAVGYLPTLDAWLPQAPDGEFPPIPFVEALPPTDDGLLGYIR